MFFTMSNYVLATDEAGLCLLKLKKQEFKDFMIGSFFAIAVIVKQVYWAVVALDSLQDNLVPLKNISALT